MMLSHFIYLLFFCILFFFFIVEGVKELWDILMRVFFIFFFSLGSKNCVCVFFSGVLFKLCQCFFFQCFPFVFTGLNHIWILFIPSNSYFHFLPMYFF